LFLGLFLVKITAHLYLLKYVLTSKVDKAEFYALRKIETLNDFAKLHRK